MSNAVLITRKANGAIQLHSDQMTYALVTKRVVTVERYNSIISMDTRTRFVAFRPVNAAHYVMAQPYSMIPADGYSYFVRLSDGGAYLSGDVIIYEFAPYTAFPNTEVKTSARFNLYNSAGELTFSSTKFPLSLPYVFGGQVSLKDEKHISGGYDKRFPIDPNRKYAIGFTPVSYTVHSYKTGGDIGAFDIVTRVMGGEFQTQQRRHYIGKANSGYGFALNTYGSSYITHFLVDVTLIDAAIP